MEGLLKTLLTICIFTQLRGKYVGDDQIQIWSQKQHIEVQKKFSRNVEVGYGYWAKEPGCWWTGCQSKLHRYACPASTYKHESIECLVPVNYINVRCCQTPIQGEVITSMAFITNPTIKADIFPNANILIPIKTHGKATTSTFPAFSAPTTTIAPAVIIVTTTIEPAITIRTTTTVATTIAPITIALNTATVPAITIETATTTPHTTIATTITLSPTTITAPAITIETTTIAPTTITAPAITIETTTIAPTTTTAPTITIKTTTTTSTIIIAPTTIAPISKLSSTTIIASTSKLAPTTIVAPTSTLTHHSHSSKTRMPTTTIAHSWQQQRLLQQRQQQNQHGLQQQEDHHQQGILQQEPRNYQLSLQQQLQKYHLSLQQHQLRLLQQRLQQRKRGRSMSFFCNGKLLVTSLFWFCSELNLIYHNP